MVAHASNPSAGEVEITGSTGLDGQLVLSNQLVLASITGPASKGKVGSNRES